MLTDLRLKIRNFIKKNKWKIVLFFIAWAVLVVVSQMLLNSKNEVPITTYEPYEPIIENGQTTPEKWHNDIEDIIDEYIEHCNKKEYKEAYYMIGENCRKQIYPTLESFMAYVNYVFSQKRLYSIQNFSNQGNVYIYRVRIFEDIMATGLTDSDTFKYFEEKITFTEKDGKLIMGVKEYIGDESLNDGYDDQFIKIIISNKTMSYDCETYTIQFQNKTEYDIVIADDAAKAEIQLITSGGEVNRIINENWKTIHIPARSKISMNIYFTKFYDLGEKSTGIKFNNIRVLRSYSGDEELREKELEEAVQLYSVTIPLK